MKEREPRRVIDNALMYARRGWYVFCLQGKVPFKGSHGLKDGTCDPLLLQDMFSRYPNANIGLKTGKESGIIVVDIDPRHDGHKSAEELKLPSTLLVRTPRGGIHRYYEHPRDQEYKSPIGLLSGIDIRSDGAYVVLPPSVIGNRSYQWVKEDFRIAKAPAFLLQLLTKKPTIQSESTTTTAKGDKWLGGALERATEGSRNATGFWLACMLRDDGLSESEARQILIAYHERVPQGSEPYRLSEAMASLRSAYSRGRRNPAKKI